jgi:predicted lactoylglutathione lyase
MKNRLEDQRPPGPGFHLAFVSLNRRAVEEFYNAALEYGGSDNGAPGLRVHCGPHCYAAFVVDPDGHHIEAVFKSAE